MIEVNTKQAKDQLSSLLEVVETKQTSVKIFHDDKVVAEIVPAAESKFRSQHDLHEEPAEESGDEYPYKTIGETLSKR